MPREIQAVLSFATPCCATPRLLPMVYSLDARSRNVVRSRAIPFGFAAIEVYFR